MLVFCVCFGILVFGEDVAAAEVAPDTPIVEEDQDADPESLSEDQSPMGDSEKVEPAEDLKIIEEDPDTDPESLLEDESLVSDREKVELVEDSNVSEALRRRPDLNFTNVTIDGEKASVSLADIQVQQVEAAEVSKAATPDLDANTTGSGLNLRSRATYEFEKPLFNGSVETTFNAIIDKFQSKASITYGRSMGRWGFILTGSTNQGRHANENYVQDWDRIEGTDGDRFVVREQMITHSQGKVEEYTANGTIDFRIGDDIRLYLKGDVTVNEYEGYNPHQINRYWLGNYSPITGSRTEVSGARIERNLTGWESELDNTTISNGGYFDYDRVQIDYVLSYNERHYIEPDWFVINFVCDDATIVVDASDREFPTFTPADDAGFDLRDPGEFRFDRVSSQVWGNDDRQMLGTLNVKTPFLLEWFPGYVKAGLKHRSFKRKQYSITDVYTGYQGVFTLADVVADYHNADVMDGRYDHGPMPDLHASRTFLANNLERFTYSLTESRLDTDPGTWTVEEDISAAYGLIYLARGGLRLVVGVRFEQTDLSYEAGEVLLDENGEFVNANRLTDSNSYRNYFPAIHFRYDRGRFSYTGSWSNTIWRPFYGMVVPYRYVNQRDEFIGQGNPELRPSLIENYNAAVDYKISDGTTLSLELFYKDVEDTFFHKVTLVRGRPVCRLQAGHQPERSDGTV